ERVDVQFLRHHADGGGGGARLAVDVEAPDRGRAGGLDDQLGQDVDQRRLAGAVGAEQAEEAAARERQVDVDERLLGRAALGPIGLVEAAHGHGVVRKTGGRSGGQGVSVAETERHAVDYGLAAWVSSAPPRRKQSRVNECRSNRRKPWKQTVKPWPARAST